VPLEIDPHNTSALLLYLPERKAKPTVWQRVLSLPSEIEPNIEGKAVLARTQKPCTRWKRRNANALHLVSNDSSVGISKAMHFADLASVSRPLCGPHHRRHSTIAGGSLFNCSVQPSTARSE
jgi:hypothetical protein